MATTSKNKLLRHSSEIAALDPDAPLSKRLTARIKEVRLQRGMLQEGLAKKAGISREALIRLEGGTADSRISTFDNLLKGLSLRCEFNLVTDDSTRLVVLPVTTPAATGEIMRQITNEVNANLPLGTNVTTDDIRRVFIAHGFTVKEGQSDLKPYVFDAARALLRLARNSGELSYQSEVAKWMDACFGPVVSGDVQERNYRFLEEALELVQALGCTKEEAYQLVDYVFNRPVGEHEQEVGGVMLTLAALCAAHKIDMDELGRRELSRAWTVIDKIRAKQAAKPKFGPLPEAGASTSANEPPATVNYPVQTVGVETAMFAKNLAALRSRLASEIVAYTDASRALADEIVNDAFNDAFGNEDAAPDESFKLTA